MHYISEIKLCFIMPTFKGLTPNTSNPIFWVLNWFLSFILCYYWVLQAHLQRFRVLEVFWCHGIIKNSHLFCLYSAVGSFPLGMLRQGSWQLLVSQAKSLHGLGWSALLSTPAAGTATLVFIVGNFRAKASVISTMLPASVGKMKSLSSYKYTGDPDVTFAVFRSLRMRVQISF